MNRDEARELVKHRISSYKALLVAEKQRLAELEKQEKEPLPTLEECRDILFNHGDSELHDCKEQQLEECFAAFRRAADVLDAVIEFRERWTPAPHTDDCHCGGCLLYAKVRDP